MLINKAETILGAWKMPWSVEMQTGERLSLSELFSLFWQVAIMIKQEKKIVTGEVKGGQFGFSS